MQPEAGFLTIQKAEIFNGCGVLGKFDFSEKHNGRSE